MVLYVQTLLVPCLHAWVKGVVFDRWQSLLPALYTLLLSPDHDSGASRAYPVVFVCIIYQPWETCNFLVFVM